MKIDIASIFLDVQNFRHGEAKTEKDALHFLLSDEKTHKVAELADDIVEQNGLDPSSLLIVAEDEDNPGQYIALEGNRRIAALKTLMTPDLALGAPTYAQFKALHQRFLALNISQVECVVLDRQEAATWIKRKHYKGMGGAGVVPWNAVATARSDASEGRFTRWMTALAFLEENGVDAEDIRDRIASKTTTVERVLSSNYMATGLGLSFGKSGKLTPANGDATSAVRLVQALMEAMSEREFVETKVSNAAQQQTFLETFLHLSVKKPDAKVGGGSSDGGAPSGGSSGPGGKAASGGAGAGGGGPTGGKGSRTASTGSAGTTRSKPVKLRKHLAKSGLQISNASLNKFYSELRSLNVEKNPHISSAIIRVFVEKSSAYFLDFMAIPPLNKNAGATWNDYGVKFKDKVGAVLGKLDPKKKDQSLSYARDVANGNTDKVHTADHLNSAIHSHLALPSHAEIVTIWDRFHPYLLALFNEIEKMQQQS
ncbi:MAG: hypothetical protein KDC47_06900 [Flavobacteriaceae bacterium]|nr:hypothetical protein [Flavobacteriaceae bacterium]